MSSDDLAALFAPPPDYRSLYDHAPDAPENPHFRVALAWEDLLTALRRLRPFATAWTSPDIAVYASIRIDAQADGTVTMHGINRAFIRCETTITSAAVYVPGSVLVPFTQLFEFVLAIKTVKRGKQYVTITGYAKGIRVRIDSNLDDESITLQTSDPSTFTWNEESEERYEFGFVASDFVSALECCIPAAAPAADRLTDRRSVALAIITNGNADFVATDGFRCHVAPRPETRRPKLAYPLPPVTIPLEAAKSAVRLIGICKGTEPITFALAKTMYDHTLESRSYDFTIASPQQGWRLHGLLLGRDGLKFPPYRTFFDQSLGGADCVDITVDSDQFAEAVRAAMGRMSGHRPFADRAYSAHWARFQVKKNTITISKSDKDALTPKPVTIEGTIRKELPYTFTLDAKYLLDALSTHHGTVRLRKTRDQEQGVNPLYLDFDRTVPNRRVIMPEDMVAIMTVRVNK